MSLLKKGYITIAISKDCYAWHKYSINIIINWFSKINKINTIMIAAQSQPSELASLNADISINDIFGQKIPAKYAIIISGENRPDFPSNCALFISTNKDIINNVKRVYIPQLFLSMHEHRKSIDPDDYINLHTNFCAYLYSVTCEHRVRYFNVINSYLPVTALGKCCGPPGIKTTRHVHNDVESYNDIAIELYSNGGFKFVIAIENSMGKGYSTEKLINAIIANCIPIYWGDSHIFNYINKSRLIYAPDYTDIDLVSRIKEINENAELFDEIISEPCFIVPSENVFDTYEKELCCALSDLD